MGFETRKQSYYDYRSCITIALRVITSGKAELLTYRSFSGKIRRLKPPDISSGIPGLFEAIRE